MSLPGPALNTVCAIWFTLLTLIAPAQATVSLSSADLPITEDHASPGDETDLPGKTAGFSRAFIVYSAVPVEPARPAKLTSQPSWQRWPQAPPA